MSSSTTGGSCATCQQPAGLRCTNCLSVFYCSKEHQRVDWPQHKLKCRAYEVKSSAEFGRHIVASKNVKKGEMLFREEPVVLGPSFGSRDYGLLLMACPGCFRAYPPYPESCPRCKWPACSKSCSGLTNPDRHGKECALFAIVKKVLKSCPMEVVLPLRCLLLQTTKPETWKTIKELATEASAKHVNAKRDEQLAVLENKLVESVSRFVTKFIPDCSAKTVKMIFDLLEVCGRELFTPSSGPLEGIYPTYCRLVHSCLPNSRIELELPPESADPGNDGWKSRMTAYATRDIAKGEPLTYCFVVTLFSTIDRQEQLYEKFNFRCSCARCLDPHELGLNCATLKCGSLNCDGYVVPTEPAKIETCDWSCDSGCFCKGCCRKVSSEEISAVYDVISCEVASSTRYTSPNLESTEKLEELIKLLEAIMHPNHQMCFIVRHLAATYYGNEMDEGIDGISLQKLRRKSELCRQCREYLENPNFPHNSFLIAEMFVHQFDADFEIAKRNFASKIWDKDRTTEALVDCRALLRGATEVLSRSSGCYSRQKASMEKSIITHGSVLVTWAKSMGLELPDN